MKFAGCVLMNPSPWGPRIGGKLPNGSEVYFQARKVGIETDDRLTWIDPSGVTRHFMVDQIHGGFSHVTIRYADNGDHVWVESEGKVASSIDLSNSDFRAELQKQHPWAIVGAGAPLASGKTGSLIWLMGPW